MAAANERSVVRKVAWRLLPFSILIYTIAAIDRTNVGFAALQMNKALGFSSGVFGFGAGIFFIGYALFEVPSNLILIRTGARKWIARIMITWGLIVIAMAWTSGEYSFYLLRFLLGVAEAGFLPGMIYYLQHWIPREERARCFAIFLFGPILGSIVGGPLGGALLSLDGWLGFAGWQLLFILEGVPAIILGFVTLAALTDRPETATWLSESEKATLANLIAQQERVHDERRAHSLWQAFKSVSVWKLAAFVFFMQIANYGVVLWMPLIIRSFGALSSFQIGFASSGPFVLALFAMFAWGRHSDATRERKWHLVLSMLVGAIGLGLSGVLANLALAYMGLCLAVVGITSTFGVFWALPGDYLRGIGSAGGLALINSIGLLGGFVGPYLVGFVRDRSPGFTTALLMLATSAVVAAVVAATLRVMAHPEADKAIALSPAK
jgi:ACS family tartrate transporter-like MFS transporter